MIFQGVMYSLYFSPTVVAQYTPSPRWAQAIALLESTLYVHGGLSDPSNSYSYTSAPEISDLLILDLSTSFNASSPPWQLFSTNSSPALAWHTLSAFSPTELLLFGGQPGPNSKTVLTTLNDSSGVLLTSGKSGPSFLMEPQNWAQEPMRRIRHSASFTSGKVWIVGGEKADGSGNAFSEHYDFSPSGPEFAQLPSSSSAPPDVYGHASLVLPDGRLLVLGGYCSSCAELMPMNTVWSLNTTTSPPTWEMLSVSSTSLPSPRRDFAAVVLPSGQILIHGGGDAQLQTTYSDGWILDMGQDPIVWSNIAALAQLGPRKDHFAVQAGSYVLFGFGYASSSPASASLFIYEPVSSSMVPSYAAPPPGSTPAITSLLPPTQTSLDPTPNGGASTASLGSSSGSSSNSSGSSIGPGSHTTVIALGTTFGVLGLVVVGFATVYYVNRRRSRGGRTAGTFFPLENDPEPPSEEGSVSGTATVVHFEGQASERGRAVDMPGVITDVLAHLGISKFSSPPPQPRKDMFADEDARSSGWAGHSGAVHRQDSEGTSVWSLRSVSALVLGVIGREPGGSGVNQGDHEWEKTDHFREEAQEGLIRQGSLHSASSSPPAHRRDGSFFSYTDPFEDPLPDDDYDGLILRQGVPEKDAGYDRVLRDDETDSPEWPIPNPRDSVWPFCGRSLNRTLTPLREVSHISLTDPSNSLPSLQESSHEETIFDNLDYALPAQLAGTSLTSYSPTLTRSSDTHPVTFAPRYSSISGSTLSRSPSISRPDSWWSRIPKPPFLDRRASITSKTLDFRDPIPAPPLVAFDETKGPLAAPADSNDTLVNRLVGHDRSLSSTHSGRTANTDSAEHLGGTHDVVQRLASDGSSSRRVPSLGAVEITEQGVFANAGDNRAPTEVALSNSLLHIDPPLFLPMIPPEPLVSPDSSATSKKGTIVTGRVKAYECRLSQELGSQQTPPPRNTRRCEEVPSRSRPTIHYGVAPHASLYIANPDLGHLS